MGFSLSKATKNVLYGFGNVLCNGFEFDIKQEDKKDKTSITIKHFNAFSSWKKDENSRYIIDVTTGDRYDSDSYSTLRKKCAATFVATPIAQSIGLVLNLTNRIGKLFLFAHLWAPSANRYNFKVRLAEMGKDLLRIVATPFILVGLFFAAALGATISPHNGRKLYATLERSAYAGGYHLFILRNKNYLQTALIGLCFQPEPKVHFFGGKIGEKDAW